MAFQVTTKDQAGKVEDYLKPLSSYKRAEERAQKALDKLPAEIVSVSIHDGEGRHRHTFTRPRVVTYPL